MSTVMQARLARGCQVQSSKIYLKVYSTSEICRHGQVKTVLFEIIMNRFCESKMSRCVRRQMQMNGGTWTQIAYDPRAEIAGSCRRNILASTVEIEKKQNLEAFFYQIIHRTQISFLKMQLLRHSSGLYLPSCVSLVKIKPVS